jgi:hypothetical protein
LSYLTLQIGGKPIPRISSAKALGVHIDETLSWTMHIEQISKKISASIGALKRVRPYVPMASLQTMYNSFVQPKFDYCSTVWDGMGSELARKIQKLQNRAVRIITNSPYDCSSGPLLANLGMDTLIVRRGKLLAMEMFKIYNKQAPEYLINKFRMVQTPYDTGYMLGIKITITSAKNKLWKKALWL